MTPDIASLLPHAGDMVLIDRVIAMDEHHIVCETDSHRRTDNPLRRDERLHAVALLEYAAQCMGLHGALTSREGRARLAFLAAARDVTLNVETLHELPGTLQLRADKLLDTSGGVIYDTAAMHEDHCLMRARLTVMTPQEH